MVIDNKYNIGEVVYLLTDESQLKRIVVGIVIRSGVHVLYELACGEMRSYHIECEITKNKVYS